MRKICITLALLVMLGISFIHPAAASLQEGGFIPCLGMQNQNGKSIETYYVRPGDTLWNISRQYKVNLNTLIALNQVDEKTDLQIGKMLKIPAAAAAHVHYIKPGETMWEIASSYGISTGELMQLNPGQNPDNLKIGDRLTIPVGAVYRSVAQEPSRGILLSAMFSWPVIGTITSAYGWRHGSFHHGLDIAASRGTPIRACADGKVILAGYKSVYGLTVMIRHADGRVSLYGHTRKIYVKPGQKVVKGQVIAAVGTTGNSTGPHVHFEVRKGTQTFNPLKFLPH